MLTTLMVTQLDMKSHLKSVEATPKEKHNRNQQQREQICHAVDPQNLHIDRATRIIPLETYMIWDSSETDLEAQAYQMICFCWSQLEVVGSSARYCYVVRRFQERHGEQQN